MATDAAAKLHEVERRTIAALARNRMNSANAAAAALVRIHALGDLYVDLWTRGEVLGVDVAVAGRPILDARERDHRLCGALHAAAKGVEPNSQTRDAIIITALRRGHSARAAAALALPTGAIVKGEKAIGGERGANRIANRCDGNAERLLLDLRAVDAMSFATVDPHKAEQLKRTASDLCTELEILVASKKVPEHANISSVLRGLLAGGAQPKRNVMDSVQEMTGASRRAVERACKEARVEAVQVRGANGRVQRIDLRLPA